MSRRHLFAVAAALSLSITPHPAAAEGNAPPLPDAGQLADLLRSYDVPGLAMATLEQCEPQPVQVAGAADMESGTAVAPNTAFEAASLSKPVFAWLVMSLAEDGLIDIDRPFAESFAYPRITDKQAYAKLTPRMVLAHRTGLPNWVNEEIEFHQRTAAIEFIAPPDTTYSYSGEGYQLLQAYVEAETGKTLQQLFHERLGDVMPNSTFARPLPVGVVPARGYARASAPGNSRGLDALTSRGVAAGSLVTTAGDYARFIGHVCAQRGLSAASYREMLRPQSPVPGADLPTSWSLGFMQLTLQEGTFIGHTGNNDEFRALAGFLPETGEGIVILTNGYNGQAMIDAIVQPPPETTSSPEAVFEEFWSIYNDGYALFDVKHVDWDAVHRVYRPRITAQTSDATLWQTLSEIIGLLNDVHVTLRDPTQDRTVRSGGRSIGIGAFYNGEFSLPLIAQTYAHDGLASRADGRLQFGWLERRIGYLRIGAFRDPQASAAIADEALDLLADARGLIIDVRQNGGGDDRAGQAIGNRFVSEPRTYMTSSMRRIGIHPAEFEPPAPWRLQPGGPRQYTGPIVLLINSRSISAAENFALAMRALPHALLIGETTAGVMADTGRQRLPNGWEVTVPVNQFRDTAGISWEGIGITPDLWVKNRRGDIDAGRDKVLETAIAFLDAEAVQARDRLPRDAAAQR